MPIGRKGSTRIGGAGKVKKSKNPRNPLSFEGKNQKGKLSQVAMSGEGDRLGEGRKAG